jgi:hypothetical protein
MIQTNRSGGLSLRRMLVVSLAALGIAAGTIVRLGAADAHAADLPYSAFDYPALCNHLISYDQIDHRTLDVAADLLVTKNQWARVWVELTNYWTGQVVLVNGSGWTEMAEGPLFPGGHYLPGIRLILPDGIAVRATVWVDWYDPAANYAYEGPTAFIVSSYRSVQWATATAFDKYYAGC